MFNVNKPAGDPLNTLAVMADGLAFSKVIQVKHNGVTTRAAIDNSFVGDVMRESMKFLALAEEILGRDSDSPALDYTQYDVYQKEVIAVTMQTKIQILSQE